ncbi:MULTISPECIES: CRISPR-associated CARF protein Csa3 [Natrialbaceae]|uniref:CRISPR-associated CARF protein Csa3 n=1 Tax=Natrialbaceae TaxID=1644061 RepID=UPI00207D2CBD|nr:CRISPR-associated CARF protein Csa3 [Natronococcus sp. CG52]
MRTYVSTIGFDSTRVTRPILTNGLEQGDRIVLLQPNDQNESSRANEAVADVERLVEELQPSTTVDRVEIRYDAFHTAIGQCSSLITNQQGEMVVVLGGGARDIYLPLALATFVHKHDVDAVLQFSDIDGSVTELVFPDLTVSLSDRQLEILSYLAYLDSDLSLSELSEETNIAKSTVTRHVSELEELGFMYTEYHGKRKYVSITDEGVLYQEIY